MNMCSKCNTENEDGVKFCRECGNNLIAENPSHTKADLKEGIKKVWHGIKKSVFFRKRKNTAITLSALVLSVLLVIGIINSGYVMFVAAYTMGNYDAAKSIKNWDSNSRETKKSIEEFVFNKMNGYYDDYRDGTASYEETTKKLKVAKTFCKDGRIKTKVENLYASRNAFAKAEELLGNGEIYDALLEYSKVVEDDENYEKAHEKINENKPIVKQQALIDMQACAESGDFEAGLKIVYDMNKIFSSDSDINAYKTDFENKKEEHRIQEMKNNQQVEVMSADFRINHPQYKALYPDQFTAIVRNNTDKMVKEYTIAFMAYDANGLPVKVKSQYSIFAGSYEYTGLNDNANLAPGSLTGYNYGWSVDEDHLKISRVIACITKATFYDGTSWSNPYYTYWRSKYEGKPLKD